MTRSVNCRSNFIRFWWLAWCAAIVTSAIAQTTGQVQIMSIPSEGLQYVLDNKYRMTDRQLTLTEGNHRFVFWAPEHEMLDTSFFVIGNWTTPINIRLKRPDDYVAYRKQLERYEKRRHLGRVIPPIVAGGAGVWTAVSTVRYGRAHSSLKDMRARYETSSDPGVILKLKQEEIPDAKDNFARARTQTIISSSIFAASLASIAYIRIRQQRSTPPVYQDLERTRFEGLVWVPDVHGGYFATAITIPIK